LSGLGIGAFIGTVSPITNMDKIGTVNLLTYILPYLYGVIPNVFFAGALIFSVVLLTRKFVPVYTILAAILMIGLIGSSLARSGESSIASLIEPFGQIAIHNFYKYWTAVQKNSLLIPFTGYFLSNRLIWIALGFSILFITYKKFAFIQTKESGKQQPVILPETKQNLVYSKLIASIQVTRIFNFKNHFRQMLYTVKYEFINMVKNKYFLLFILFGMIIIFFFGFRNVGLVRGTQTFPVTSQLLETIKDPLYIFNLILILFCSGEIIWLNRNKKTADIIDVLPVPEWVMFIGKLFSLFLVQALLMFVIMVCALLIQTWHGYFNYEIGLYFRELFANSLIYFCFIIVFAMFSQVLINKKFLAYIFTIFFVDDLLPGIGFEHHLWRFGSKPNYLITDMNGYGPFFKSILYYDMHWFFLSIVLIIISLLLVIRGKDVRLKSRIKIMKKRISASKMRVAVPALFGWLLFGSIIFYNTNILNEFNSSEQIKKQRANYEISYKKYENMPQPQITDIKLNLDLYPYERKLFSKGHMLLENKTDTVINKVFIQAINPIQINKISINRNNSLLEFSKEHGVSIYKMDVPLKPSERIELNFEFEIVEKGFKDSDINTGLVSNGTFLQFNQLIPSIGYDAFSRYEIGDNDVRKEFNLAPKERIASINDKQARLHTPVGKDGTWINFEAILSTSIDQIALTAGEFVKKWTEGNRKYFHYKSNQKILKYFPLISGRYNVQKDKWHGVDIEIYHHPGHDYNLDLMTKAVKKSLDYYTENFGPYQSDQIRIVEFPKYSLYAECFANIIPVSEGYGFIARFDTNNVEYSFRVTAHETAHQWWGHQVMGANVQGALFIGETITQYSAIMVTKNEYERNKIRDYFKIRIDSYLRGRARETERELPLMLANFETPYIQYEKGLVVMYALQDYIGESNLNAVLKEYINETAYQGPPYTTSLELIERFRTATPDSLQYVITDMFETITLYENRVLNASYEKTENGKYRVTVAFEAKKIRVDNSGNENTIDMNNYISFGVFDQDGEELYLKKHWIKSGKNKLQFIVDKIPASAGIDPNYYLIDKNVDDNIAQVDEKI